MRKKPETRDKKKWDTAQLLVFFVLLVSAPRLGAAFSHADPDLLGIPIAPVTGIGTAIIFELGIYYMTRVMLVAWRKKLVMGKVPMWAVIAPFIAFELIVAPIIALPAGLGVIRGLSIAEVLGSGDLPWLVVAYAAPSVLVVGVSVAGAIERRDWVVKRDGTTTKSKKPMPVAVSPYACTAEGCSGYGKDWKTQRSYAAHCGGRSHKEAKGAQP